MRYVVVHKMPAGMTRDDFIRLQKESQGDPNIKGIRSFINLSESKGVCILDAPDKNALANWFKNKGVSYDSIFEVELESERGKLVDLPVEVGAGTGI